MVSENGRNTRIVLSIQRMTVHNGPGIRTLVLFKGCPLRCVWCSTPESQKVEPEIAIYPDKCTYCNRCVSICPLNAISFKDDTLTIDRTICNNCGKCVPVCYAEALKLMGKPMTIEELLEEVQKDEVIFKHSNGGVTFSGGEPLFDPGFALKLTQAFKKEHVSVGIDTSGYVPRNELKQMLPYIDFFLWDIKHMNPDKHKVITGVSNELILNNARIVSEMKVPLYIRIPVIPGYNDSETNIRATCEFARRLSSVVEIALLPVHHLGKAKYLSLNRYYPIDDVPMISENIIVNRKQLVESYGLKCSIGS